MPGGHEKIGGVLGYVPGGLGRGARLGRDPRGLPGRPLARPLPQAAPAAEQGPVTILPLDPVANASPEALTGSFRNAAAAAQSGRPRLVSITIQVDSLDPLAVLESIFEPGERHFYAERPSRAGPSPGPSRCSTFSASGPGRFAECQWLHRPDPRGRGRGRRAGRSPFGGPHFFAAFTFLDTVGEGEPFEAASVFVPRAGRWRTGTGGRRPSPTWSWRATRRSSCPRREGCWRAHAKFRSFDFRAPGLPGEPAAAPSIGRGRAPELRGRGQPGPRAIAGASSRRSCSPGRRTCGPAPAAPARMLNGLRQRFPDCNAFSVANGRGQSFIGASPEPAARRGRRRAHRGARRVDGPGGDGERGRRARAAPPRSEKDLREQRIVLDSIVRRLAPARARPEVPARPVLKRLSNVQHLHTPVEAALPEGRAAPRDARAGCTRRPPSGARPPSGQSCPLIAELEAFPRGLYGGALGWIDSRGGGEFIVGLRSALVDGPRARMYAGAGSSRGRPPRWSSRRPSSSSGRCRTPCSGLTEPARPVRKPPPSTPRNVNSLWGSVVAETLVRSGVRGRSSPRARARRRWRSRSRGTRDRGDPGPRRALGGLLRARPGQAGHAAGRPPVHERDGGGQLLPGRHRGPRVRGAADS
jgi:menaquinone-specific isochorismate synthase